MKAFMGFDKDPEAALCRKGFRACENPLDTFRCYPPTESRYCTVDIDDNGQRNSDDLCAEKIKIGAEIGPDGVIKAGAQFILELCKEPADDHAPGECSDAASGWTGNAAASGTWSNAAASGLSDNAAASGLSGNAAASGWKGNAAASGRKGNAAASGEGGNAAASGECGNAAASGAYGNAAASGECGNAAASGAWGTAAASGECGNAAAFGVCGNAAVSGDGGNAAASGAWGTATVTGRYGGAKALGNDCLAAAWGPESKAMGKAGNWLVLSEHECGAIVDARLVRVDGEIIKSDTWYVLRNGKIVEAE